MHLSQLADQAGLIPQLKPLPQLGDLGNLGNLGGLTISHEPSTAAKMDSIVAQTRLKTAPAVAEGRKLPRKSVAELNDMDLDELRDRFINSHSDNRGPMETVLDWLDAPRNLIYSTLAPGLRRRAEEHGDKGAMGLGRVHASDVLEELGVSSPVARGILGFVGDVALDPLTYIGAPAKGLELGADAIKGSRAVYSFTKPGRAALMADLEHVAGGGAGKSAFAPYLSKVAKEQGIKLGEPGAKEALSSHVLGKLHEESLGQAVGAVTQRKPFEALRQTWGGTVGKVERRLGIGEEAYKGSMLARDLERADEVGDAARSALKAHGEYISEPGLRLGVGKGEAATRLFHVPFTSYSLMVPALIKANGQAQKISAVANMVRNGTIDAARVNPEAAQILAAHLGTVDDTIRVANLGEAKMAQNAAADAEIARLRNEPPPPPPASGGGTLSPINPPTPGGAPAAPRSPEEIASSLRTQSQMAGAREEAGIVAPKTTPTVDALADAGTPAPIKTRAALIQELHANFANVPQQARNDSIDLLDSFMRAHGVKPEEYGKYLQGFTTSKEKGLIRPLFQADTFHGTPHVFEPVAVIEKPSEGMRFRVPLSHTIEDETLSRGIADGTYKIDRVHKYGQFDSSKMGTGEGQQAFGWGHYSAEADAVAKDYRKKGRTFLLDGNPVTDDRLRSLLKDAVAGNPNSSNLVEDVMRQVLYDSPEYAAERNAERAKDRMMTRWYHDIASIHPDLIDVFEKRLDMLDDGEMLSDKLLKVVRGEESTGNAALDEQIRNAVKFGPDERELIGVDRIQHVLDGLERSPSSTHYRLEPVGGVRAMRRMSDDDKAAMFEIESRLSWASGKTGADKLAKVRADLLKTIDAQSSWLQHYAKDARVLSDPEAETVVRIVNEAIANGSKDIGIIKPENIVRRVQNELDEYVRLGYISNGTVDAKTIENLVRSDLGDHVADAMVRTPQWEEVEPWLYGPSQNKRREDAQRTIDKAKSALAFMDKHKPQYIERRAGGALYNTRVLADDDELLHWDKTIGEQPPKVRSVLRSLISPKAAIGGMLDDMKGSDAYRYLANAVPPNANTPPSQKTASQLLDSLGVKGVKYLDGMSRGGGTGTHNYVIFNDNNIKIVDALFHKNEKLRRAAITFDDDGLALIHNLGTANEVSLPHELAHGFRRWLKKLNPDELAKVESHYGIVDRTKGRDGWTRTLEERYAKDFEDYLATGKAPTSELAGVFERFKQWMAEVYRRIVGTPIEDKLSPEMRNHFNRILGGVDEPRIIGNKRVRSLGSKNEVVKRLSRATEEMQSMMHQGDASDALVAGEKYGGGTPFSAAFRGDMHPDVVEELKGPRFKLLKHIQANLPGGGAEDFIREHGLDKWFELLERTHGSEEAKAIRYARQMADDPNSDPAIGFYLHLLESWPKVETTGGERVRTLSGVVRRVGHTRAPGIAKEGINLASVAPDTAFTIHGEPMFVSHGGIGPVVHYGQGKTVPGSAIGDFAVDAGSVRMMSEEEAAKAFAESESLGAAGSAPDDIPFSPGSPLFHSDLPNQGGLFGQGNVGPSGEKQGGLFGDTAPVERPKQIDPMAQREGESLDDWKIRVKFAQAEKNTSTLFHQDDIPDLLPDEDPIAAVEAGREQQNKIIDEEIKATLAAAKAKMEIAGGILSNMDPAKYGQTPASLETAMLLSRQYDQAVAAAERAEAVAGTLETFKAGLPSIAGRDKETVLRELEPLGKEIAERIYELGLKQPDVVAKIADAAQRSVETANAMTEIHKGQFSTWASSADLGLRAYARSVLGIDNVAASPTVFARVAEVVKHWGTDDNSPLVSTLDKMDEWARRTFNTHGGYKVRAVADMSAHARAGQRVAENHARHEIQTAVKQVLSDHGLSEHVDQAMPIVYALMHRIVDPGQSAYNWARKTPNGPQGLSAMAQALDDAGKAGVFTKAFPDLEKLAAQSVEKIRGMGDQEIAVDLLDSLMSNYVPIVPSSDAKGLMLAQKTAFPETKLGQGGGAGTPPFALRRTTHQRYFKNDLDLEGKWHWYYGFDEWLMDKRSGFYHSDGNLKTAAEIAGERQIPVAKAQAYLDSLEAQEKWAELVKADPSAETRYPWKPTDAYELNELYHNDRLGSLVGGSKDPEDLFDTRMDFVMGARDGQHQRAMANKKLASLLDREMFLFPNQDVIRNAAQKVGESRRLANGVVVTAMGMDKSSLGKDVPYFGIGKDRYRMIDPGVREGFLGRLLPDTILRGIVPVDIADHVEKAAQMSRPENLWPIIRTADELVGIWKKTTLFSPSWTINDTIGNLFLAVSGGAKVRDMGKHAPQMLMLRKALYTPEKAAAMTFKLADGRMITGEHLLNVMMERRIIENTLPAEVAAQYALENKTLLSKPNKYLDKLFVPNLRLNMFTQDWMRMTAFMSHLEQGHDLDTAVFKTMHSMLDWGDFTRTETQVFRRLIPFYSWLRNNLAYQAHLLVTDPKWAASVPKLHQAIEEMLAGDALVPQEDRPGWMRESLSTQLTKDPSKRIGLMFAEALPTSDLYHFMLPLVGAEGAMKFANALGTSITPAIGIPYQISAGKEFFSGRSIGPDKFSADLSVGEFLRDQVRPVGEISKVGEAFGRSPGEGVARSLVGGRIQAMDDARLASTLDRQDRDQEARLRGAISRANRRGDADTQLEATARLLRLYERRKARGQDIPNWADQRLEAMAEPAA